MQFNPCKDWLAADFRSDYLRNLKIFSNVLECDISMGPFDEVFVGVVTAHSHNKTVVLADGINNIYPSISPRNR